MRYRVRQVDITACYGQHAETSIATITREFVAVCLEEQDGDSAAA